MTDPSPPSGIQVIDRAVTLLDVLARASWRPCRPTAW